MIEQLGDRPTVLPEPDQPRTAKSYLGKLAFAALWKIKKGRCELLNEFDKYNQFFYETKMGPEYKVDYDCWCGLSKLLKKAIKDRGYNPDGDAQKLINQSVDKKYKIKERSMVDSVVTCDDGTVLTNMLVPHDNDEKKHYFRIFTRFTNKHGIFPWYWGNSDKWEAPSGENRPATKMRDIEPEW